VGTVLKQKWRLDRLLGIGGMAAVYAATHRNGKRVAIKVLHEELARNLDVRTRFLREGYLANAVDHEGVMSIVDDDVTEDGEIFLVMELLDGETVERRWERKDRRLPVGEALWIASELLDVLAAAHAKGVVHRDVKPENVFLARVGSGVKVKILDFGIAKLRELSSSASTTQNGATMGTPAFMSPEQARGRWDEVEARSDVWAVGAMLFSLLSGRFVHEAATLNEQLLAAMTTPAPAAAAVMPELPLEVANLIDRALASRIDDRWESARAMQDAIRTALSSVEARPPSQPDADKTDAMPALDFGPEEARAIEAVQATAQGVANAPSAAPAAHARAFPMRRSPYFVGIGAGALGVALALVALVHAPAQARSSAMGPARAIDEPAPVSALVVESLPHPADQLPVSDAPGVASDGELPGLTNIQVQPAPPATGVPPSLPLETAPPSPQPRREAPAPSPPEAQELSPAPAPPPSTAAAAPPAPETPTDTEGLLDRRH
jgi:serine/threonine-protein kinase